MPYAKTPILIVDDESGLRDLLEESLEEAGYICYTASSGDGALAVLAIEAIDLALVDIMMPGMSGLSLFQHLKKHYPEVAVVFVTAVGDLNVAVEHLKNGAYDYVVKPVTRKRLHSVVEEALDRRKVLVEEKEQRRRLEEQWALQAKALEARIREVAGLNRMLQAELTERLTQTETGGGEVRSGVNELPT